MAFNHEYYTQPTIASVSTRKGLQIERWCKGRGNKGGVHRGARTQDARRGWVTTPVKMQGLEHAQGAVAVSACSGDQDAGQLQGRGHRSRCKKRLQCGEMAYTAGKMK